MDDSFIDLVVTVSQADWDMITAEAVVNSYSPPLPHSMDDSFIDLVVTISQADWDMITAEAVVNSYSPPSAS
jgi:hypothetical protein